MRSARTTAPSLPADDRDRGVEREGGGGGGDVGMERGVFGSDI